jgi:hypothetical protein
MATNGSRKKTSPMQDVQEYDRGLDQARKQGTVHSFLEGAVRHEIQARAEAVVALEDTGVGILQELQEFRNEARLGLEGMDKKFDRIEALLGNYAKENKATAARLEEEFKKVHAASMAQETRYGEVLRKLSQDDAKDEEQEKEITGVKNQLVTTRTELQSQHEKGVEGVTALVRQTEADLKRRYTMLKVVKGGAIAGTAVTLWEIFKAIMGH